MVSRSDLREIELNSEEQPEIDIKMHTYFNVHHPDWTLIERLDVAGRKVREALLDLLPTAQTKAEEIDQELTAFDFFIDGRNNFEGIEVTAYCNRPCDYEAGEEYQAFVNWFAQQLAARLKPIVQKHWFRRPDCKNIRFTVSLSNKIYSFSGAIGQKRIQNKGPWGGLSTEVTDRYNYKPIKVSALAERLDWSDEDVEDLMLQLKADNRELKAVLVTDDPAAIAEGKDVLIATNLGWLYLDKNSELVQLDSAKQPILMSGSTIDKGSDKMDDIYSVLYDRFYDEHDAAKRLGVEWGDLYGINVAVENAGYGSVWQYLVAKQKYANVLEVNGVDLLEVLDDGSVGRLENGTFKSCEEEVNQAVEGLISAGLLDKSVVPVDTGSPEEPPAEVAETEIPDESAESDSKEEPEVIPENSSKTGGSAVRKVNTNSGRQRKPVPVNSASRPWEYYDEPDHDTSPSPTYGGNSFDFNLPEDWDENDNWDSSWNASFPYGSVNPDLSPVSQASYHAARSYQEIGDALGLSASEVGYILSSLDSNSFGGFNIDGVLVCDSEEYVDGEDVYDLEPGERVLVFSNQGVYGWIADGHGNNTFTRISESVNSSVDASATNAGDIPSKEESIMVNSGKKPVSTSTPGVRRRRRRKLNSAKAAPMKMSERIAQKLNCSTTPPRQKYNYYEVEPEEAAERLGVSLQQLQSLAQKWEGNGIDVRQFAVTDDPNAEKEGVSVLATTLQGDYVVDGEGNLTDAGLNSALRDKGWGEEYDPDSEYAGSMRQIYRDEAGEDDDTSDEELEGVIKDAYKNQDDVPIRIAVARAAAAKKRKKRGLNSSENQGVYDADWVLSVLVNHMLDYAPDEIHSKAYLGEMDSPYGDAEIIVQGSGEYLPEVESALNNIPNDDYDAFIQQPGIAEIPLRYSCTVTDNQVHDTTMGELRSLVESILDNMQQSNISSSKKTKDCVNCDSDTDADTDTDFAANDVTITTESGNEVPMQDVKIIQNPETNELMLYVPENEDDEIPDGFAVIGMVVPDAVDSVPAIEGGDVCPECGQDPCVCEGEDDDEGLDSSCESDSKDTQEKLNSNRIPAPKREAPSKKKNNAITRR